MDVLDVQKEQSTAEAMPYEHRVYRQLAGERRRERVTTVLTPDGKLIHHPVHAFNAGTICGGDHMLKAEPSRYDDKYGAVEWSIEIRPSYKRLGYVLYRDFLADQSDGAAYAKLLDSVLDKLAFDVNGRPTGEIALSQKQVDGILHPKAAARRVEFRDGKKLADKSSIVAQLEALGIVDAQADAVADTPEQREERRENARKQLRQQGVIK